MKDIHQILAEAGFTVPADKKEAFENGLRENYKTIAEVNKITAARDSAQSQLQNVQNLLDTKTAEYDELKSAAGDDSKLQETINKMKSDFETEKENLKTDYQKQLKRSTIANKIISDYRPNDVNDILGHLDLEKVTVDGDNITGLTEQMDALKESKAYYFEAQAKEKGSGLDHGGDGGIDESAIRKAAGLKD